MASCCARPRSTADDGHLPRQRPEPAEERRVPALRAERELRPRADAAVHRSACSSSTRTARRQRDAAGRFHETYTQRDVEELARVLTGWTPRPRSAGDRPTGTGATGASRWCPSTWPPERDAGAKVVMGRYFPAGQSTEKDLRRRDRPADGAPEHRALRQPAPDPAPGQERPVAGLRRRVAAKFRDNGQGVAGDMKAVVKAVLLDPEARAATTRAALGCRRQVPRAVPAMAMWRGLGCTTLPRTNWGGLGHLGRRNQSRSGNQCLQLLRAHRPRTRQQPARPRAAPAHGQKTPQPMGLFEWTSVWNNQTRTRSYADLERRGLQRGAAGRAPSRRPPRVFNDLLSARFFRGAMPPTLRTQHRADHAPTWPPWNKQRPFEGADAHARLRAGHPLLRSEQMMHPPALPGRRRRRLAGRHRSAR